MVLQGFPGNQEKIKKNQFGHKESTFDWSSIDPPTIHSFGGPIARRTYYEKNDNISPDSLTSYLHVLTILNTLILEGTWENLIIELFEAGRGRGGLPLSINTISLAHILLLFESINVCGTSSWLTKLQKWNAIKCLKKWCLNTEKIVLQWNFWSQLLGVESKV